jgi:hypothetical protein
MANFNSYYQSFNNEMYKPINNRIRCVLFCQDDELNKFPLSRLYILNQEKKLWESVDNPNHIDLVKDSNVVEWIAIHPYDKFPAEKRNK